MKKSLYSLPEVFFIGVALYWIYDNYTASNSVNYFAIAVIAVMLFQLKFAKKMAGIFYSVILTLFSLFMMLAVHSEYNEFPAGSAKAFKFLMVGEGVFLFSALMAGAMVYKYVTQKAQITNVQPAS